jgi:hypothetical protein
MKYKKYTRHGLTHTHLFRVYRGILSRCYNKNDKAFKHYGGRGIKCEWDNVVDFYNDMNTSYKDGLEIDRINVNGNYCKKNCRWATRKEQLNNMRKTTRFKYKNKEYTLNEFSDKFGINKSCLRGRINKGIRDDRLIEKDNLFNKKINGMRRDKICKNIGITTSALYFRLKKMNKNEAITKKAAKNSGKFIPKTIKYNNKYYTINELANIYGLKYDTLRSRLYVRKWSLEKSLKTKVKQYAKNN